MTKSVLAVEQSELLPCPKCGKRAFLDMHNSVWCIQDRCVRMPAYETQAEALAAWNTRTAHQPSVDQDEVESGEMLDARMLVARFDEMALEVRETGQCILRDNDLCDLEEARSALDERLRTANPAS